MSRKTLLLLILITLAGAWFRMSGADWGFPILGHPDEATVSRHAFHLAASGEWDPRTYLRPNHFSAYTHSILYRIVNFISFETPIEISYSDHLNSFYYASRLLNGFFGALLVPLAYFIVRELDPKASMLAALSIALYPSFTKHSHYITPDITIPLFTGLCTLFSIRFIKTKKYSDIFISILAASIAFSDKYPGAICVFIIASAILSQKNVSLKNRAIELTGSAAAYLLCLFAVAPYLFINYTSVIDAFSNESRSNHAGADGLGPLGNIGFYLNEFNIALGTLFTALVAYGFFTLCLKQRNIAIPLLSSLVYLVLFAMVPLHWERWGTPIYFSLLLISSTGISHLFGVLQRRKYLLYPAYTLVAISFLNLLIETLALNKEFRTEDTRIASLLFCEENQINNQNAYYEQYTPFAPSGGARDGTFSPNILTRISQDNSIRYVLISSFMYDRFFAEPEKYYYIIAAHEELAGYTLIKEFESSGYTTAKRANRSRLAIYNLWKNGPRAIKFSLGKTKLLAGPTIKIYDLQN